jgi:cell shape-determining protein MreC
MLRHLFHIHIPVLPPIVSLELAIFLVSIKIIWMIHKESKIEHFQFWMLNSIEFRLNDVARRIGEIEKKFSAKQLSDMENRSVFPSAGEAG